MSDRLASIRSTARTLADLSLVRESLRLDRAHSTLAAAVRIGVAAGLALVVPALAGHADVAAFSALGGLTALYARYDTYRRRATLLAVVGAVMVGSIAVFSLVAALRLPTAASFALMALLAGGMTAFVLLLRTGAPGATIVVFAAGGGLAGAPVLADVLPRTLAGAFGAAIAWLVVMSGVLVRPSAPARLAVRRAEGAVTEALDVGTLRLRASAEAALDAARHALADDASWGRTRATAFELARDLDRCEAALHHRARPDADAAAPLPPRRTLRAQARENLRTHGWGLATTRVTVAGVAASAASAALGLGHESWAVMGSTAVLQGATARHMAVRAIQRASGTIVGALLIAYPLLSAGLGFWTTAAVVVVLQIATEVVIARHYGLAQLLIVPMALLMTSLGSPADAATLALDRALDTTIGAAAGILAVVLIHRYGRDVA